MRRFTFVMTIRHFPETEDQGARTGHREGAPESHHSLTSDQVPQARLTGGQDYEFGRREVHRDNVLAVEDTVIDVRGESVSSQPCVGARQRDAGAKERIPRCAGYACVHRPRD